MTKNETTIETSQVCLLLCYNKCYNVLLTNVAGSDTLPTMLEPKRLASIRTRLDLSQEQMARVLGVSFVSVNRWEGGHSSPTGATLDLYLAVDAAIRAGNPPAAIRQAANGERSTFLYTLFRMAYANGTRRAR